jgi:hypothetical protein
MLGEAKIEYYLLLLLIFFPFFFVFSKITKLLHCRFFLEFLSGHVTEVYL